MLLRAPTRKLLHSEEPEVFLKPWRGDICQDQACPMLARLNTEIMQQPGYAFQKGATSYQHHTPPAGGLQENII